MNILKKKYLLILRIVATFPGSERTQPPEQHEQFLGGREQFPDQQHVTCNRTKDALPIEQLAGLRRRQSAGRPLLPASADHAALVRAAQDARATDPDGRAGRLSEPPDPEPTPGAANVGPAQSTIATNQKLATARQSTDHSAESTLFGDETEQ